MPVDILVFRLNREKDHFSLYACTDKAKESFSLEQDRGEKKTSSIFERNISTGTTRSAFSDTRII